MGKGIIDPVDDIRASNPPSNPALLDALTKDFVEHDFDLRHLMRTIVNSRTYQASHRHQRVERERPRQLLACHSAAAYRGAVDGCGCLGGGRPAALPRCSRRHGRSQLVDPHIGKDGFLDLFGRPARESACECERRADFSLPQALNLVNGRTISDAVADPKGRVAKAGLERQERRGDGGRALSCGAEPPPDAGGTPARMKYLSNAAKGKPRPGSAVGAAQQQSISVHLLKERTSC